MTQLIVNADDFGYARGVNEGIVHGFEKGIIRSTTLMANGGAFEHAVGLARANPGLGVGCHLVLVGGPCVAPRSQVASLVDSEGFLPSSLAVLLAKLAAGSFRQEEITREFRAQVEKVMRAGIRPTHFDSHKHAHARPQVLEGLIRVAEEFGVRRMRMPFESFGAVLKTPSGDGLRGWKQRAMALAAQASAPRFRKLAQAHSLIMPDHFWGVAATGTFDRETLLAMISSMGEGTNELMCHPGYVDADLRQSPTRLKGERERELEALVDPVVLRAVEDKQIRLMSFRELD